LVVTGGGYFLYRFRGSGLSLKPNLRFNIKNRFKGKRYDMDLRFSKMAAVIIRYIISIIIGAVVFVLLGALISPSFGIVADILTIMFVALVSVLFGLYLMYMVRNDEQYDYIIDNDLIEERIAILESELIYWEAYKNGEFDSPNKDFPLHHKDVNEEFAINTSEDDNESLVKK